MRRYIISAALIGTLVGAGGCARGATMSEGGDVDLPSTNVVGLRVDNQYRNDVDVYAVSGGISNRLGMVVAHESGTFELSPSQYVRPDFRLIARPISGQGLANSGVLSVRAGDLIAFTIAPALAQSSALVR